MVCLITIKNLKRCPVCILYEYKSHTKCMDTPLFTPLFTPGPISLERETTCTVNPATLPATYLYTRFPTPPSRGGVVYGMLNRKGFWHTATPCECFSVVLLDQIFEITLRRSNLRICETKNEKEQSLSLSASVWPFSGPRSTCEITEHELCVSPDAPRLSHLIRNE